MWAGLVFWLGSFFRGFFVAPCMKPTREGLVHEIWTQLSVIFLKILNKVKTGKLSHNSGLPFWGFLAGSDSDFVWSFNSSRNFFQALTIGSTSGRTKRSQRRSRSRTAAPTSTSTLTTRPAAAAVAASCRSTARSSFRRRASVLRRSRNSGRRFRSTASPARRAPRPSAPLLPFLVRQVFALDGSWL